MIGLLLLFVSLLIAVPSASTAGDYQVTFQTNDCNGDTGLATVQISAIYKIEAVQCGAPHENAVRKQVLVSSAARAGSYDIFTINEEEAVMIQREIQSYMKARRKLLEHGDVLILEK